MNRRAFGAVALWAGAVAVVAGLSWVAIDSAGRQVAAGESIQLPRVVAHGGTGRPSASLPATTSGTPAPATSGSDEPESDEPETPGSTATTVTATPPRRGPQVTGTVPRHPTDTGTAPTRTATKSTAAGSVAVACTGARITRWSAQPRNGWRVEERSSSATLVTVEFTGASGEIRVAGHCTGGAPVFSVEQDGPDSDGQGARRTSTSTSTSTSTD